MATPGYGKQSAPEQHPRSASDFTHLPAREAYLASLIDRLPDGAAMDVKTLAALQPHYGQMACRTVLNNLSTAGHLRRVRERMSSKDCRWVFRTFFSRTPRSDAWWNHFLATGETSTENAPDPPKERTLNRTSPTSAAYAALAGLGFADSRLALSAADCAALEPLAAEWLARGATPALFTAALTAGLPTPVHSPVALTRRRLIDKLPPERPAPAGEATQAAQAAQPVRVPECTDCRTPCRPQALLGGLCRACRSPGGVSRAAPPVRHLSPAAVRRHAARVRQAMSAGSTAPRS
ncbi:MarR family transcriptional regulator [Kitasatospora sp. Ki12]